MNILITSAGRRGYMVDFFKDALSESGKVFIGNSSSMSSAFYHADDAVVTPLIYDENYIPFLLNYCKKNNITTILSLFDIDLPILSKNKKNFLDNNINIIVSDINVINVCNDKYQTYLFCNENFIRVPKTFITIEEVKLALEANEIRFPLIIKPRWGMGSIAIYEADNMNELEVFFNKVKANITNTYLKYEAQCDLDKSVVIQEKLLGEEYGLDIINDLNGEYCTTVIKKKYAMRSGETDCAVVVENEAISNFAKKLAQLLRHVGNMDADIFLTSDGKIYLLELNARFGGGYPFSHMAGINLPKAIIKWINNEKLEDELIVKKYNDVLMKEIQILNISRRFAEENLMIIDQMVTPCYVINKEQFINNCKDIENSFKNLWGDNICFGYSVKTNCHPILLELANKLGWYPEVVSSDELKYVKSLGYDYPNIIYNGPNKGSLLLEACEKGAIVNIDNLQEADYLCTQLKDQEKNGLRVGIRINFDLERICPGETTAGNKVSRFGICFENGEVGKAISLLRRNNISIAGLHMHTSTKTRSKEVFLQLAKMVCQIVAEYNLELTYIDMGGGFFGGKKIVDKPTMKDYAEVICNSLLTTFDSKKTTLVLEPGASVVATAIDYLTTVNNVRNIQDVKIITLDGTLLHINPFLTKRVPNYKILDSGKKIIKKQEICGCTCMENDRFFELTDSYELMTGNMIRFKDAGAYTMSFNSHFIVEPPVTYLMEGNDYKLITN